MAKFNPNEYETVEERLHRFYADHPHGRVITENQTTLQDRQVSTWVVAASIYLPNPLEGGDQYVLKATGLAFEVDGGNGANSTSALENCETSAIGRALANAGYSGSKRTTREEMAKANRGVTPKPAGAPAITPEVLNNLFAAINATTTKIELRNLWRDSAALLNESTPDGTTTFKTLIIERQKELPESDVF